MRYSGALAVVLASLLLATAANAGPKGNNGSANGNGHPEGTKCPPGLAKKNPPCVPPGQARKAVPNDPYAPGDHLPAGYTVILRPQVQPLPDTSVYARLGDQVYRVDRETGRVLELIGALSTLLH